MTITFNLPKIKYKQVKHIMAYLQQYSPLAFGFLLIWLSYISFRFWQMQTKYKQLTEGVTKENLEEVFKKLFSDLKSDRNIIDKTKEDLAQVTLESQAHLQKIGLVRFNPFPETGGNQSFSLAVMDENDNGVVLSSLHSRETTRLYAKPLSKGLCKEYDLSAEEKKAINLAVKSRN